MKHATNHSSRQATIWRSLYSTFVILLAASSSQAELPRIMLLGDSVSLGYGSALAQQMQGKAVVFRLGDLGKAMTNLDKPTGANGGNSERVLQILNSAQQKGEAKADWLLLNCGLHDIKTNPRSGARQIPLAQYEKNLKACVDTANRMNIRVIWVTITPIVDELHNTQMARFHRYAADVDAYNEAAKRVMNEAGAPILDLYTFSKTLIPGGFKDHVHFTPDAAAKQAEFLARELTPLLQKYPPAQRAKTKQ